MTLANQYNTLYNRASVSFSTIKKAITFDYFTGETRNMLSHAIKSLTDTKSTCINDIRTVRTININILIQMVILL